VEAGWVALWRQVDPLPVESKAELQFLIESYLRRNKPAAPPSAAGNGCGSGTGTVSLREAVQPALLRRVERYFETTRGKRCEIDHGAWRRFVSWCEDTGQTPLPCTSEVLLRYLDALDRRGLSGCTMAQAVTAVGRVYRIAGLPSPVSPEARALVHSALEQRYDFPSDDVEVEKEGAERHGTVEPKRAFSASEKVAARWGQKGKKDRN
jgi:hypothetical protein